MAVEATLIAEKAEVLFVVIHTMCSVTVNLLEAGRGTRGGLMLKIRL